MRKMVRKTSAEIRSEWTPERIAALKSSDFEVSNGDVTDGDIFGGAVKCVGRGFAASGANISTAGQAKAGKKQVVTISLPNDLVADMRRSRGYSRIIADYVLAGIKRGDLQIPSPDT